MEQLELPVLERPPDLPSDSTKKNAQNKNEILDFWIVRMKKIFEDARPCRGEEAYKPTEHQQQNNSGSPQAPEISVFLTM